MVVDLPEETGRQECVRCDVARQNRREEARALLHLAMFDLPSLYDDQVMTKVGSAESHSARPLNR